MAKPRHKPTDDQLAKCQAYAMVGVPHHDIAKLLGISTPTLLARYRDQLHLGKATATANVGGRLYKAAMAGSVPSMIFWMKSQAGWREVAQVDHKHMGAQGGPIQQEIKQQSAHVSLVTFDPIEAQKQYLNFINGTE